MRRSPASGAGASNGGGGAESGFCLAPGFKAPPIRGTRWLMVFARPLIAESQDELRALSSRLGRPSRAISLFLTGLDDQSSTYLRAWSSQTFTPGERPGTGVVVGEAGQIDALIDAAKRTHPALAEALDRGRRCLEPPEPWVLGGRRIEWGSKTLIMGIVNVTPDSFSDGGAHLSADAAVSHAGRLIEEGADWIDVGGESTRPGSEPVPKEVELERVLPVIERLHRRFPDVPLSIDTSKPEVATAAMRAGAALVNDVTGLSEEMARVVAAHGVCACVMHMRGTPRTMQRNPHYEDVVAEVVEELRAHLDRAQRCGNPLRRLMVDPGIGFGKTAGHNLQLLRQLGALRTLGVPVLVGVSRKAFLGSLTGRAASERAVASAACAAVVAASGGVDVVRVHDVAATRDALAVADAIRSHSDGGTLFERPE